MAGLYIVADLSSLGAAARLFAGAGDNPATAGSLPSFGHAGADAAAERFRAAADRHAQHMVEANRNAAGILRGYVVAFHAAGD